MEQYLIDTNVVSDYLSNSFPVTGMDFMDNVIDQIPKISVITQIELLCWNADKATEQNVKEFITDSNVQQITPEVIVHCVGLRKGKKIKTPDAIIAATAKANKLILITGNKRDFSNIKELKIINPHKMKEK
jgi:hypothetical protein